MADQGVAKLIVFRAFLASDGKTVATGKTIAITISKNGGAFGNPNAGATNATEISSGFYKFTLDTTDTDTLGPLAWRGAEGTINDAGDVLEVEVAKATASAQTTLQTSVDDIPTNSELATALDPLPTVTEFNARTLPTADYATTAAQVALQTGVDDIPNNAEAGTAHSATLTAIGALNNFNPATTEVLADVKKINGTTVNGNGSTTPWGP